ncbi:FG-GAP-like repeat-containing protein [Micromonospora sp. WMMD882]|uniref:LamG-like jellyroll fold domain-containing protein n=1 Tax=Micromonospora sp. WMMD882 TaxID=3015151 RepID=UPI00248C3374|nr:LamG-like jellyroll fold domain-containing protein [Micromonospora sp. WMMD882]WBB78832.1 FG-GAP-like repeat-containing protein [Micromonospora sp. WMMD882]
MPSAPASAADCRAAVDDRAAAIELAARCDQRVEILAARTETTQVFANPDGTGVVEEYAQPQRVRRADGTWTAPDPTLVTNPDGSLSPRAATFSLRISGGGAGPLVRASRDSDQVSLSWPDGPLPTPVVSGARATYREVYPGVDLVVTAVRTGFSEVLVVKDRAAAANPALREVAFGTELTGLRWQDDGDNLVAVDAEGRPALGASAPKMWDSTTDPGGAARGATAAERVPSGERLRSSVDGPAVGSRTADMPVDLDADRVEITPDRALLEDPATVYPVYLDPTITYTSWTMINKQYPSQSYWSYDKKDCPGTYTGECAKVGYSDWDPGNPVTYRSMWQFPTSAFRGKQVLGAQFTLDLLYSWECGKSVTELERINTTLSSSTTWSNNSDNWPGTNTATVSNESCDGARVPTEFAITSLVRDLAGGSATYVTLGLKAGSESSHAGWKKYDADTARLVVTTNTVPGVPTTPTVDAKACVVGAGRPYTSTATPTLRARVADGDGNSLTASFEWARIRYNGTYGPVSDPRTQSSVPSGTVAQVDLPAGVLDKGDEMVGAGDWDGDGVVDVLGRDPNGVLYVFPGKGQTLTSRAVIGSGWSGYTIAGVGDWDRDGHQDIVARQNNTDELWLYPGQSRRVGSTETRTLIGASFGGYAFAGIGDWDRDGHQDLLARDSAGVLWLYPGQSTRGAANQPRVNLGSGWTSYTYFGVVDYDRDGAPDLVAKDPSGALWLYLGSGARASYGGSPYRHQIGSGWTSYSGLTLPDLSGDGKPDVIAEHDGKNWYVYPGPGARASLGSRYTAGTVGLSDGAYAFRVNASDAHATSGYTGWCEFEVDQTNPEPPAVTSDTYHAGSVGCPPAGCGAVGQTGSFTFASVSPDVVSYKWGFSDPPATTVGAPTAGAPVTVQWTPPSGGAKTLYVQAVDRAGRFSQRTHQFVVAAPTPALARWRLAEPAGSTTLVDDTGHGRHATLTAGTLGVPGRIVGGDTALRLTGAGQASTATPVLADTSRSFSVAAWVKLGDKSVKRTIVSQGGTHNAAFVLEYLSSADTWKFTVTSADSGTPAYHGASSAAGTPRVGVWTHLVGTFDSTAGELRLYVNGVLAGTATGASTWDANGPTRIGGPLPGLWSGELAQVQLWNRVLAGSEAAALVDPVTDSLVGRWDLEDIGPGPSFDGSNYAHDLSFHGGAEIPPSGSGHTGTGLQLDGVDAYAETDGPVLNTDQSFTVSAWARLPVGVTGNRTVLAQRGAVESGIFVKYEATDGRWHCVYGDTDHTTATGAYVGSNNLAAEGVWTHLTCVYDAQAATLTLYVDRIAQRTVGVVNRWHANGPLMLGRVQWRAGMFEHWSGAIDEVRVYQGVVRDLNRIP